MIERDVCAWITKSDIFASILLTTTIQLYYHNTKTQNCLDHHHLLSYIVIMVCVTQYQ